MGRLLLIGWSGVVLLAAGGCASGPLLDNPAHLNVSQKPGCVQNPVYVALGPTSYSHVFETVLDIVDDYFEISVENRYEGRIETFPRIAPGLEQFWKEGSPDFDERVLATLQTIRHRAVVLIQPAEDGGYFVEVTVYKELEDLPRPNHQTAGSAIFRSDATVERQFEVIDPTVYESNWIPMGRDTCLEQEILERIKSCL